MANKYKFKEFAFLAMFAGGVFLFPIITLASQAPEAPCDFYGYEETGTVLTAEDVITARDPDGVLCGSYTVTQAGQYGFLSCTADDPNTPAIDEGAVEGDTITLFLNGIEAVNTGTWTKGGTVNVNIGEVVDTEEVSIDFHVNFNQTGFVVTPDGLPTPYMASRLIQDMAAQGLTISIVMQWDGAIWISHYYNLTFTDFELDLDEGIFLKAVSETYYAGTWTISGRKINLPKTFNLRQGWNLVNIPTTIGTTTAIETLQQINSQGGSAEVMMWWDGAIWISTGVDLFFTDQVLVKGRSYFIRCAQASAWEMQ